MLNEDWFATGDEDGSLALWFAMKKKPTVLVPAAHGYSAARTPRWISAIGCLKQSDLVVTGSNDGLARIWRADVEERSLQQVSHRLDPHTDPVKRPTQRRSVLPSSGGCLL